MTQHRARFASFILVGLLTACANSTTPEPVGGETHFLHACDGTDSCGAGLECVCGVCTKPCTTDNTCKDQDMRATCEPSGTPNGACVNPQASPVCDVECSGNADCNSLGSGYTCEQGSCRKLSIDACVHDGVIYESGATFVNGCTSCTCSHSVLECGDRCGDGGMDAPFDSGDNGNPPVDQACVDTGDQDAGSIAFGSWVPRDPAPRCAAATAALQIPGAEIVSNGGPSFGGFWAPFEVNDTDVYWLDERDYVVVRTAIANGRTWESIQLNGLTSSLLLDDCLLYLGFGRNEQHNVTTVALNSGGLLSLGTNPESGDTSGVMTLAVDTTHAYAQAGHMIYRAALGSGPLETILEKYIDEATYYSNMLLVSDRVFVSEVRAETSFVILSIDKADPTNVTTFTTLTTGVTGMAADSTSLYVTTASSTDPGGNPRNDSRLLRYPLVGGGAIEIDPSIRPARGLQLHDGYLYFTTYSLPGNVPTYALWRVPTSVGSPEKILDNVASARVTDSHIYWSQDCATSNGGSEGTFIARIPQPTSN